MVSCNGASPSKANKPLWRGAIGYGHFWSELIFPEDREVGIERGTVIATNDFFIADRFSLQLGVGGVTGGSLKVDDYQVDIGAGWVGSISGSYNILDGTDDYPFLVMTLTLGASSAQTLAPAPHVSGRLFATDLRLGVAVGYTLAEVLNPYLAARLFGGPVKWKIDREDITGSDKHHYQLGAGVVVSLPANFDLYAEGVPLGERAVTAGLGLTY